jgi:3-phosphoshikimate 1-carboxyvinyltransferase
MTVITPHRFTGIIRVPASKSHTIHRLLIAALADGVSEIEHPEDTQGDKAFFTFLEKMGCKVQWELIPLERVSMADPVVEELHPLGLQALGVQLAELHFAEWQLTVSRDGPLLGGEFDLNDTPDMLPALAVVACFAHGDTALVNAANARIKETDRIAVMAEELGKLGVKTTEHPDALIVHGTGKIPQSPSKLDGRNDDRVVMALACAALGCSQPVEIAGAESAAVTYPGFMEMLIPGGLI